MMGGSSGRAALPHSRRRLTSRDRARRLDAAAVQLQGAWRGKACRQQLQAEATARFARAEQAAAQHIQGAARVRHSKRLVSERREGFISESMQRITNNLAPFERMRVGVERESAIHIQRWWRAARLRFTIKAAIAIQRKARVAIKKKQTKKSKSSSRLRQRRPSIGGGLRGSPTGRRPSISSPTMPTLSQS